jgi:hypothetical protein
MCGSWQNWIRRLSSGWFSSLDIGIQATGYLLLSNNNPQRKLHLRIFAAIFAAHKPFVTAYWGAIPTSAWAHPKPNFEKLHVPKSSQSNRISRLQRPAYC